MTQIIKKLAFTCLQYFPNQGNTASKDEATDEGIVFHVWLSGHRAYLWCDAKTPYELSLFQKDQHNDKKLAPTWTVADMYSMKHLDLTHVFEEGAGRLLLQPGMETFTLLYLNFNKLGTQLYRTEGLVIAQMIINKEEQQ